MSTNPPQRETVTSPERLSRSSSQGRLVKFPTTIVTIIMKPCSTCQADLGKSATFLLLQRNGSQDLDEKTRHQTLETKPSCVRNRINASDWGGSKRSPAPPAPPCTHSKRGPIRVPHSWGSCAECVKEDNSEVELVLTLLTLR